MALGICESQPVAEPRPNSARLLKQCQFSSYMLSHHEHAPAARCAQQ